MKTVINEIKPEGVNADTDMVKVVRKGYKPAIENKSEKLGVVMVELRTAENLNISVTAASAELIV